MTSGKKSKILRRGQLAPRNTIIIDVFDNGVVQVKGFPMDFSNAISLMYAGTTAVVNYFLSKAREGNLDDRGRVDERIIVPDLKV